MTYTEWRDELKNNLLSVSESERRRVLDYYAEAYADRREAGFSEHEIIESFGAPYDAAQRILCDRSDYSDEFFDDEKDRREHKSEDEYRHRREDNERRKSEDEKPREDSENKKSPKADDTKDGGETPNNGWLFVLLCIIFAAPLFGLLMGMVGVSIGLCVAPFAVLISGIGIMGSGIGAMVGGEVLVGLGTVGIGLIVLGVGIILTSVFTKIVKFIWKVWNSFFKWLKSLFGIKEKEKAK